MSRRKAYLVMVFSAPLLYLAVVRFSGLPPFILPPPGLVVRVFVEEGGKLLHHAGITALEALGGFALANLVGVSLAVAFLYVRWLENFSFPWLIVIRNVPFVVIGSILIILFGDTPLLKVLIVSLVSFFGIVANINKGLQETNPQLIDRMRVLNASRWAIFTKVRWPGALPFYLAALEIGAPGSVMGAIVAEWLFPTEGLGYLILSGMSQYRADRTYAVTIVSFGLAISMYLGVKALESRLLRWQKGE